MGVPHLFGFVHRVVMALLFKAIQLGDVSRVAPIDKLSVVITILLAFLFLHEQPLLKVVIGAVLIVSGSIFMSNSPLNFRSL